MVDWFLSHQLWFLQECDHTMVQFLNDLTVSPNFGASNRNHQSNLESIHINRPRNRTTTMTLFRWLRRFTIRHEQPIKRDRIREDSHWHSSFVFFFLRKSYVVIRTISMIKTLHHCNNNHNYTEYFPSAFSYWWIVVI